MIPIINTSTSSYETEASIKYFLIQAASSALLLTSIIIFISNTLKGLRTIIIISRLIIKLGMAPFHIWLPQVLNGLIWPLVILITTWQKIGPLAIISYTLHIWNPTALLFAVTISAIVGRLGGLSQTQIRPLIAYSSISHIAWILARRAISNRLTAIYFAFYSFITIILILPIKSIAKSTTSEFNISTQLSNNLSSSTILHLLSLGGIPPLLGFIPKWIIILTLAKSITLLPIVLISSSLIRLFFYLSIFFARSLNIYKSIKINLLPPSISYLIPINMLPTIIIITII